MNTTSEVNQGTTEQLPFGAVQHNLSDITPTASEIGHLWTSYLGETMSICMLKHIVAMSKDPDIKPIVQQALDVSTKRVKTMEEIYKAINHPIPEGFGEKDVDANAPVLFSESFNLAYTRIMNIYVELHYSFSLARSSRSDFRQFFSEAMTTSKDIIEKATDVLLAKGLLSKSPSIIIPDRIEYVDNKNYYGSIFGGKRSLNAVEVSHLYYCMLLEIVFKTLKLGFSQVAESKEVMECLKRGSKICNEHAKILGSILREENLPALIDGEYQVTDSKHSPYSDKLMLFHCTIVASYRTLSDGFALTSCARKDLISGFSRLIAENMEYSKDGTDLMIEKGWLEKVPQTVNRQELLQ